MDIPGEREPDEDDAGAPSSDGALAGAVMSFRCDAAMELVYASAGFERLTGYAGDWLIAGRDRFWQLFRADEREWLRSFVAARRTQPESLVVRVVHRDGHVVRVEFCMMPAVTTAPDAAMADGWMIPASLGTREERAVARLLRDVGKELRGPIGALTIASTTLARSDVELSEDQRRSAMDIIDQSGRHVADSLVRMLGLAQLRQRPVAAREPVRLVELVQRVVDEEHAGTSTEVRVTGDPSLTAVVERTSFERAIRELVRNGLDHGGRHVAVRVTRSDGEVAVEVADDGPGVPVELTHRLFEPFSARRPDRQRGRRAGLGLAIALAAVQRSGGTVDHRPRRRSGALFTVRLPAASAAGAPVASVPTVRVVVLAAERLTGDALAAGLSKAPRIAEAVSVTDVEAAESLVVQLRADVVVVDLDRPANDALEESQRLRGSSPSTRLVMIGTALTLRDLAASVDVGAVGLVPKELGLAALVEALGRVLHENVFVDTATLLELSRTPERDERGDVLTDREHDVLQLMAQGYDAARISKELGLQVSTCRGYIKSILAKLQAHTQLEAVVVACRLGLVAVPGADRARPIGPRAVRRRGSGQ